jgi:trans-aconitate methyltransferase
VILDDGVNTIPAWDARARAGSVGWSERSAEIRYRAVHAELEQAEHEWLLDYGCGLGAFADWREGPGYVGVDWAPAMLDAAVERHPDCNFAPPGWLWQRNTRRYSAIVAIGTFNLADNWSKEHTQQVLADLWQRCARRIVVSVYAGDDPSCIRYQPDWLAELAHQLDPQTFRIVGGYLPNDLLLVLDR